MTFDLVDFVYTDYGSFYGAYFEKYDTNELFGKKRVDSFSSTGEVNSYFAERGVNIDLPDWYNPSELDTICKSISETLGVDATHNDWKDVS